MGDAFTREEFATPEGRRRAWRALMLGDHGFLRKVYDNTFEIAPGKMWRTYQPSPAKLKQWKERGVKTVINLRGEKPSGALLLEEDACEKLGLTLVNFRVFSREAPSVEVLRNARDLFEAVEYPAIMHCKSGADRAGLMSALYLFFHEKKPLDEALDQLTFKYGHVKSAKTGVIDLAFERYIQHARANNIPLNDTDALIGWAASDAYDPAALKREFKPKPLASIWMDVLLRRE
ncbi:tyrosine-protein phosphatase [Hyphococcus flavus]|uniref:Tyrosine-protein phosphatase n=1 Tax=Hyphococcus flavus TaxID=1866326 RepID=A0AAE9ZCT8_9PROT|nr:tyrosine-protein phosphatase [Hyphococcus flavus]WDI30243.1 tyrosine-protein phosphatase [Hyphococcus flavus]